MNDAAENFFACSTMTERSQAVVVAAIIASAARMGTGLLKKRPVCPSMTVSRNPPARSTTEGLPNPAASRGVRP